VAFRAYLGLRDLGPGRTAPKFACHVAGSLRTSVAGLWGSDLYGHKAEVSRC
jgi:hypothetical protein